MGKHGFGYRELRNERETLQKRFQADFVRAAERVLKKNAELYRRLG